MFAHLMKAFGVGTSLEIPNCNAPKPSFDLSKYQTPVDGLNTAISAFQSPS